jgi:diguanylate cyclase (GGDEF)-like protein
VPLGCIEIATSRALSQRQLALIEGMRGLYCNYLSLLHYSQVDTLTGLLNSKTFDDSLQKILGARECRLPSRPEGERRNGDSHDGGDNGDWLAVLDIDHFKRINDHFGHLFGDEVLLLVAGLMRQIFRRRDKLFRFGGEEFIVLLRHTSERNALKVFERFLETVARHAFPQVGQVTVSIGLTRIQPHDNPTTLLGRADEALYYAKHHGRNQLRYYEALAAEGKVVAKTLNTEAELF